MDEAREAYTNALRIFREVNVPSDRNLRVTYCQLGHLERDQQKYQAGACGNPPALGNHLATFLA